MRTKSRELLLVLPINTQISLKADAYESCAVGQRIFYVYIFVLECFSPFNVRLSRHNEYFDNSPIVRLYLASKESLESSSLYNDLERVSQSRSSTALKLCYRTLPVTSHFLLYFERNVSAYTKQLRISF